MKDTITINDFFEIAKQTDLKDLLDKSLHEPDPEKRKVYDALYTYFLDKRQDEVIKPDELLRQMGGDWHKDSDNLKAMKEEIKQLHYALDHQQSIHVETTPAGRGKAQLNLIDKAHKNGFEVTLLYVALRDENLAIQRVNERVQKGGHGVPVATISNPNIICH